MLAADQVPLSRFPLFHSNDFDETRVLVGRAFCPHRLNPVDARPHLDALQNRAQGKVTALNFLRYGTAVRIEPGELETFFLVQIPTRGSARVVCGEEQHVASPRAASVLSTTGDIKMDWAADCEQLIVWMKREAVERQLFELLGRVPRAPLRFRLDMPLTAPEGRSWLRTVKYFTDELTADYSWVREPAAMAHFEHTLIVALLYGQQHNYSAELSRESPRLAPAAVRRAEAYLRAHVADDVTMEELSTHAGVSQRALQANFARFRGTSPSQYLRELRLVGARNDLLRARRDETVTVVALRWRFSQLGRFARIYRLRFGETPSQTLLRAWVDQSTSKK